MTSSAMATAAVVSYKAQRQMGGVSITYSRSPNSVTLDVVPARTESLVANDYGVVIDERRNRDFLILASELILDGSTVLPDRGDTITEGTRTYLVSGSEGGEKHYVWSDHYEQVLRVHTVEKQTP